VSTDQGSTAYLLPCRTWLSRGVNHDNSVKNLRRASKRMKTSFNDAMVNNYSRKWNKYPPFSPMQK